ncbi:hypothetical protein VKT23_019189 [Stygiomarasmius scandens]|uniref:Protein kinase domain-containing protein n=1 Tax=Marasmiellus scandens TaxID=2682957 RepID=A0ABR1IM10_9AGAR
MDTHIPPSNWKYLGRRLEALYLKKGLPLEYVEYNEDSIRELHRNDMEIVLWVVDYLLGRQRRYKDQQASPDFAHERSSGGGYQSIPDHRMELGFQDLRDTYKACGGDGSIDMVVQTLEDKTMRVGNTVFRKKGDIVFEWPKEGDFPEVVSKNDPDYTLKSKKDPDLKSKRVAVQMAAQMAASHNRYGVFFTADRVLYVKKEGGKLIVSGPMAGKTETPVDFVQYTAWAMQSFDDGLDHFQAWHNEVAVPKINHAKSNKAESMMKVEAKANKMIHSPSSSSVARFALLPPISLHPWALIKGLEFNLFPVTKIKVGSTHSTMTLPGSWWIPEWLSKYTLPLLPVVEIHCPDWAYSWDGHKMVAISAASGVVLKMSTLPLEKFRHECEMTLKACGILPENTPKVIQIHEGNPRIILMSYTGVPLLNWSDLSLSQLQELLNLIDALHAANFHHHDIRPPNVTVDAMGRVSIIDFDCAVLVDEYECVDCEDQYAQREILELFEHKAELAEA